MSTEAPKDASKGERIAKFLSRAGVASRREAERMIEVGRVAVNGKVIDSPALNVTAKDKIVVDNIEVGTPEPARLWLYHKPAGLVTTAKDEKGRETVFDTLPEDMPRVMSVGRLDLNSEGLLLLTNDGEIKRRLELPSTGWLRKYRVRVKGNPSETDLEPLRKGIVIEGQRFQAMSVTLDRQQGANAWLTVGLREGKNREIRRAMEAVGVTVNRLIRVSYGPFRLGELKQGEVEEVRAKVMRDQLGLEPTSDITGEAKAKPKNAPGRKGPGNAPGKPGGKPMGKPGGKPGFAKGAGKPDFSRGPGSGFDRDPDRGPDRGSDRGSDRGAGRGPSRGAGKGPSKGPGKGPGRGPGRGGAKPGPARGPKSPSRRGS